MHAAAGAPSRLLVQDQKVIVDDDTGPLLPTLASNVFTELDILNYLGHSEQRVMHQREMPYH